MATQKEIRGNFKEANIDIARGYKPRQESEWDKEYEIMWGQPLFRSKEETMETDMSVIQRTIGKDKVAALLWSDLSEKEKKRISFLSHCVNTMFHENSWFTVSPLFDIDKAGYKVDFDSSAYKTLRAYHCVDMSAMKKSDKELLGKCIKQCLGME